MEKEKGNENSDCNNVPLSERPKLYKQMLDIPYELSPLNMDELFKYLNTQKVKGTISFKFYAEFLNLINTIVFYYVWIYICYHYFFSMLAFIVLRHHI